MIMKINKIIENVKDNIIYFLLIAVYFFFVNIEARKDKKKDKFIEENNSNSIYKSKEKDKTIRIDIPVIPYKEQGITE